MLRVHVAVPVRPSEDPAKVRRAFASVFPHAQPQETPGGLEADLENLNDLRALVRKQKIMDAARRSLLHSLDPSGRRASFRLNKQAAFKGRLSFAEDLENPLGDVRVDVEGENLEALFKEIAPMTINGIPVSEERAEEELARRKAFKEAKRRQKALAAPVDVVTAGDDFDDDDDEDDEDDDGSGPIPGRPGEKDAE